MVICRFKGRKLEIYDVHVVDYRCLYPGSDCHTHAHGEAINGGGGVREDDSSNSPLLVEVYTVRSVV